MKRLVSVGVFASIGLSLVGGCRVDMEGYTFGTAGSGGAGVSGESNAAHAGASGSGKANPATGGHADHAGSSSTSGSSSGGDGTPIGDSGSGNAEGGETSGGASTAGNGAGGVSNGGSGAVSNSGSGGVPSAGSGGVPSAGSGGGTPGGSGGSAGSGLLQGAKCNADTDCAQKACVDGVCCSSTCTGTCKACTAAKTGQPDGTCAGVSANTDPDNECSKDTASCGHDGMCDGVGACSFANPNTVCAPETCSGGKYTAPSHCAGNSATCNTPAPLNCANCANNACNVACTQTSNCPAGFYCASSVCTATKGNGSACQKAEECSNGSCVEGVCCDGACNTKCSSCLLANTGQTDGKCAPVKAGVSHGSDCSASLASSCGLDGKCDGAGACRNWPATTQCAAQSCATGSATQQSARNCDGSGMCRASTPTPCGNFLCDAASASCKVSCTVATQAADCGASAYCSGGSCVAKKAPGALCGSASECSSNLCGGRCCNPGAPCTCTQPTSGNLLKNPGFDSDLSSWTQDTVGGGGFAWLANSPADGNNVFGDVEQCPFSGSAFISSPANVIQRLWQCVNISPQTNYNFGNRSHSSGGAYGYCDVDLYPGANCSGNPTNVASGYWINVTWSPDLTYTFSSGISSSARVSCYNGSDFAAAFYVDQVYLSRAPSKY